MIKALEKTFDFLYERKFWLAVITLLLYLLGFSNSYKDHLLEGERKQIEQLNKDIEIYKFHMFKSRKEASMTDIKLTACLEKKGGTNATHSNNR